MATEKKWQRWLDRLYDLRRAEIGGSHERPHKPALLLTIMDLLDRHNITENKVPLSDELVHTFKRYFATVRSHNDQPTIQNPFFHLCGDQFWHLEPTRAGDTVYRKGEASGSPSVGELRRRVAFAWVDPDLWELFSEDHSRHQLREAIIARYFPEHREKISALAGATPPAQEPPVLHDEPPGRDAAFRHTVLKIYDHTCSACGIRVRLNDGFSLVEAAHIIPFDQSYNDKPNNGLALCPNHHCAMDRHLIAPCPHAEHKAGVWKVSSRLEPRIAGQKDLVALAGQPVIPPAERMFLPALESLRWREEHLNAKY